MKRISVLLLCLAMVFMISVGFAEKGEGPALKGILSGIADGTETPYIIRTLEYGPLASAALDAAPFAARLVQDAVYTESGENCPDGEYVVLIFPDQQLRYDFFCGPEKESFVREISGDKEKLYRIEYADEGTKAAELMIGWRDALAAAIGATTDWNSAGETSDVKGKIENGSYVIQAGIDIEDSGVWLAKVPEQNDAVVKIGWIELKNGQYIACFEPVGDGQATVSLCHLRKSVCDQMHTFDLVVKDGRVEEVTGGSFTASPDDQDLDAYLSGEWKEAETQFTSMTIVRNAAGGWNVEISSPLTHEAYIFKATVNYDCEVDGFVYSDGIFYNVPLTETDKTEPVHENTHGTLHFEGTDEEHLQLCWEDSERADTHVHFERI